MATLKLTPAAIQEIAEKAAQAHRSEADPKKATMAGYSAALGATIKAVLETVSGALDERDGRLRRQASRIAELERRMGGDAHD